MPRPQFDWLYIIFAHESGIADGRMFDGFFNDQINNLITSPFNDKIKVIIILNYPKVVRKLTQKEKRILNDPNRHDLIFFETWIYESQNSNEKIDLHKIGTMNYWQDAFDFVLSNFKAKQYAIHTVSHCTGHEINSTNNGFALNASGNLIKHYKSGLSSYNNSNFKRTLRQIVRRRKKIKYYLFAGRPRVNNKITKLFALNKKPLTKWGKYNNTNGLLFYDFTSYLKTKEVKFEFFLGNNCNILLYENAYLLSGIAHLILGSTGNINGEFVNAAVVYKNLPEVCSNEQKIKQIFDACLHLIDAKYPEQTITRHYSIINNDNFVSLTQKLKQIFYAINKVMQKSDIDSKALINYIKSQKDNTFKIISDDDTKPYYDILQFLRVLKNYNSEIFEDLVSDFEKELLSTKVMLHNNTTDGLNHYLSICLPDSKQMISRFTYLRNFFKSPQNLFAKEIEYDRFISQFLL